MRRRLAALVAGALAATPAAAQFPGAIAGVVTDAGSGAPVPAALVEVPTAGRAVRTDAAGAFYLRGVEAGAHRVLVRRTGYAPLFVEGAVRDGTTTRLALVLHPEPVALEGLRVRGAPERSAGEVRLDRAAIEASGARTLADLLERSGAAVVAGSGPTGERRLSVRGGAADAVLVLVDGLPLNDPVTGEADLSLVPAAALERVTVLAGARSARYGSRAETGVVLVETRAPERRRVASAAVGSLGERAAQAEWGEGGAALGVHVRALDGRFRFRSPFTGEVATRRNGDLAEGGLWGAGRLPVAGGELRLRGGWDAVDRGIPGRAYLLSPHARQEGDRTRASAGWRGSRGEVAVSLAASGERREMHYLNPAPPDSFPYDSRVRARTAALRAEVVAGGSGLLRAWGFGADATVQHLRAGSLSGEAPRGRVDAGAWTTATLGIPLAGADLTAGLDLRLDRDGVDGTLRPTHALAVSAAAAPGGLRLAHRSAFSPPTLGDQFFREGVGVAPNPALRAERVPAEWELSGWWADAVAGIDAALGGSAFLGDVRGMIVWSPDHRGIWRPRNADVDRSGVELWARLTPRDGDLQLSGEWSLNRVTYRWDAAHAPVQVIYRPRHAAAARLGWTPGPWQAELAARYTGWRNPTPENANRLPGFWTLGGRVGRSWRVAGSLLEAWLDVDRIGDERDALIFGHPEPGRRVRLDLRLRGADTP